MFSHHILEVHHKRGGTGDVEEDPGGQGVEHQGREEEQAVQAGEDH